jgi:hypothetical protein
MSSILDHLQPWVARRAADLATRNVVLTVTPGPVERDKRSAWIDIDSPRRSVRVVVWDSGEAVLEVGELSSGAIVHEEQREVTTRLGLEQTLEDAVAWAQSPDTR